MLLGGLLVALGVVGVAGDHPCGGGCSDAGAYLCFGASATRDARSRRRDASSSCPDATSARTAAAWAT